MDGFFLMSTLFTNANRMPVNCYNFGVLEHQNYAVCIAFGTRISFQKRTLNSWSVTKQRFAKQLLRTNFRRQFVISSLCVCVCVGVIAITGDDEWTSILAILLYKPQTQWDSITWCAFVYVYVCLRSNSKMSNLQIKPIYLRCLPEIPNEHLKHCKIEEDPLQLKWNYSDDYRRWSSLNELRMPRIICRANNIRLNESKSGINFVNDKK